MVALRRKLSAAGVDEAFLNGHVLPEWWDDSAALNPAGFSEAILYLSNRLGYTVDSLIADRKLEWASVSPVTRIGVVPDDPKLPLMIAFRAASVAARACNRPTVTVPLRPEELRARILVPGVRRVTLEALLEFCWNSGIPVIHLGCLPSGFKPPDPCTVKIDSRIVIVLTGIVVSHSAMTLILARQIGNVAQGLCAQDNDAADSFAAILLRDSDPTSLLDSGETPSQVVWNKMVKHLDEDLIPGEAHEWLLRLSRMPDLIHA
jgi:hypothetical protein